MILILTLLLWPVCWTNFNVCSLCDSFWEEISPCVCQSLWLYSYHSSKHICRCLGVILNVSNAAFGERARHVTFCTSGEHSRDRAFGAPSRSTGPSKENTENSCQHGCDSRLHVRFSPKINQTADCGCFCGKACGLLWRTLDNVTAWERGS